VIAAYLTLLAAVALAVAAALAPHALHAAAPYLVAGLWAGALWLAARAQHRAYHRQSRRHGRPTRLHRARAALGRARTLRITTAGRTSC